MPYLLSNDLCRRFGADWPPVVIDDVEVGPVSGALTTTPISPASSCSLMNRAFSSYSLVRSSAGPPRRGFTSPRHCGSSANRSISLESMVEAEHPHLAAAERPGGSTVTSYRWDMSHSAVGQSLRRGPTRLEFDHGHCHTRLKHWRSCARRRI